MLMWATIINKFLGLNRCDLNRLHPFPSLLAKPGRRTDTADKCSIDCVLRGSSEAGHSGFISPANCMQLFKPKPFSLTLKEVNTHSAIAVHLLFRDGNSLSSMWQLATAQLPFTELQNCTVRLSGMQRQEKRVVEWNGGDEKSPCFEIYDLQQQDVRISNIAAEKPPQNHNTATAMSHSLCGIIKHASKEKGREGNLEGLEGGREEHSKVVKKGRHYGSYFRSEEEKTSYKAVLNKIWSLKLKPDYSS
ncbi:hypothetical protein JOB18_028149 [Solea senegalensis]|uniref:Uncharacterized protein n=1 Tax=Solea senegalensis TaxID=28829 RepID=A0AAV6S4H7_SOLSE|nr:hypothetical protein JOB18_028149 [Solea senegalensis]